MLLTESMRIVKTLEIEIYQRFEVLVEAGELLLDEGEGVGGGDEGPVVPHRHLLHLPLDPLRVDSEEVRFLQFRRGSDRIRSENEQKITMRMGMSTLWRRSRVKERSSET